MLPALETSQYLGPLPLELFIYIIALSVSHLRPTNALFHLERLRLVSKTWLVTIDSTPQFWTTIQNTCKASRIKGWIQKSGEAPLCITSKDLTHTVETFMSLLRPYTHRWKDVTIWNDYFDTSAYLDRPAPLLEALTLIGVSFGHDSSLCAGVTPSLTKVDFYQVKVPRNLSFLQSLKDLRLHSVVYMNQRLRIGQIYEVLTASPELRRLRLNLEFEEDARRRTPITFPSLEGLKIHSSHDQIGQASQLLSIIDAPNLINMSTDFDRGLALQLFVSWLARQSLHQAAQYSVAVERTSLVVSISRDEHGSNSSRRARLFLSAASFDDSGIQVLEEIDKLGAPFSPLALTIRNPGCVSAFVGYLNRPKVDEEGTHRWPLPTLHSVRFNLWMNTPSWDCISGFARVRKDISRITIEPPGIDEPDENWKKWDALSMSFTPFKDE
ncbi:hypothetical protein M407DRAFT_147545 [Tulasnella calospora MUT 4182]|uniref:F-box domain-containing protein n=1 Tax=Tulasnella calospora MUT 4182 TaxID=1051891 RepID=A0A0C3QGE5_9AGAM|nr:hypothetical protein M407DRAFT_147545 [Tulasnella calospora MUT 4182]